MQGFEKIKAQILNDAAVEKADIISRAKAEADKIADISKAEAEIARTATLQKGEAELAAARSRTHFANDGNVKLAALSQKQQLIAQVFDAAQEKLMAMPADDTVILLIALGKKAAVQGGELILNIADKEKIGNRLVLGLSKATGKTYSLSDQCAPITGGFILKNGDIEINWSFDSLFVRARVELSGDVAKLLFGV